jgi:hypothetical protein
MCRSFRIYDFVIRAIEDHVHKEKIEKRKGVEFFSYLTTLRSTCRRVVVCNVKLHLRFIFEWQEKLLEARRSNDHNVEIFILLGCYAG